MANTKVTQHVIANNAITADQLASAAVTDAKLHSTLDLSGKTLTLPATAIPSASTATTQSASDNSTKLATTAYVTTAIANLNDSAPAALNTLNELAAALNDDASFSSTITTAVGTKLPLAGGTMTGDLVLGDNVKLELGSASGGDLQIYHDGSNSIISDEGTGELRLRGSSYVKIMDTNNEVGMQFRTNGALTLYHNNIAKLETAATGVDIQGTGALRIPQGTTGQRPTAAVGQIRWNTTDGALEVYNGTAWTAVGTGSSNKVLDTFTGDNSNRTFTLSVTPANEDAIMVFIDGAYQEKGDYVLTNNSLVLDTAPLTAEKIAVHTTTASVHDGTSAVNNQFTATAGQTAFTLTQDPSSENNTQVYINGVYQQKTDYTVVGTTLTFDTGLTVGDVVEVNMFTVATLGNTDTVTEGVGNLYHTTARARSAISVSGNALSYNSSTGVITSAYEESPTFTGTVTSADITVLGDGSSASEIDSNTVGSNVFLDLGGFTGTPSVARGIRFFENNASGSKTEKMRLSGGNLGIGTSSFPATYDKLAVAGGIHIQDDNSAKLEIGRYSSAASNSYIKLGANSNALKITNNDDSADIFTLTNTGQLTVGQTTSNTSTATPVSLTLGSTYSNAAGQNPKLKLWESGSEFMGLSVSSDQLEYITTDNIYDHVFYGGNSGTSEIVRFTGDGKVGIGGIVPSKQFEVQGSNHMASFINTSTGTDQYSQIQLAAGSALNWFWTANQNSTSWGGANSLNIQSTTGAIQFYTDGTTARMRIHESSGNIDIPNGNLAFANGHGIDFSTNTPNATGTSLNVGSQVLDDYEEGFWQPRPIGSTSGTSDYYAASQQLGSYIKIGNIVHLTWYVSVNDSSPTGQIQISNLPFAAKSGDTTNSKIVTGSCMWDGLPLVSGKNVVVPYMSHGAANLQFYQSGHDTGWVQTPVDTSWSMIGGISYRTV